MVALSSPTPRPAKKRPAMNTGIAVDAVCTMTPNVKIPVLKIMAQRRPSISANGAEKRAPKKVPADRIETISDCWAVVTLGGPSVGSMYPVEKFYRQYGMARMPPNGRYQFLISETGVLEKFELRAATQKSLKGGEVVTNDSCIVTIQQNCQ